MTTNEAHSQNLNEELIKNIAAKFLPLVQAMAEGRQVEFKIHAMDQAMTWVRIVDFKPHGGALRVSAYQPEKQCEQCQIVKVREIIEP